MKFTLGIQSLQQSVRTYGILVNIGALPGVNLSLLRHFYSSYEIVDHKHRFAGSLIEFLQNQIYGILFHMNYKNSETLNEIRFKRLVGVKRSTFHAMLNVLTIDYQLLYVKDGRKPKLTIKDLVMATRQYLREYRTYEQIAADFGIHETSLIRRSHWVEETLVRHGFSVGKRAVAQGETLLVDATEVRIQRPKKST